MTLEYLLGFLKGQREEIRKRFHADIRGIVGSIARGNPMPESDIDILVDFLPGATLLDYVGLAQYLEEKLRQRIDIVPEKDIRKEIRPQMLADAIYL